ncbi:MAG TPA: serine hydrolase domain-containing protein, partial [Rectinemataceae bacterium]|nr:serine hydrolase domain-containing protein [Rectinemataceae bacterium]
QGLIGLTVASVRYGSPDFSGAWGADSRGIPLRSFTPMAIGSLSRAITGILAARADKSGRIDLDKPASFYLPELAGSASLATVTLRQFLSQTSGVSALSFDDRHPAVKDQEAAMRLLASAKALSPPGTRISPINTGYDAVGLALERATKKSLAEQASIGIFKPLGMRQSEADGDEAADRLPQGGSQFFWTAIPKAESLPPSRVASSGVVSTAPDFARLMAAIVNPGFGGIDLLGRGRSRDARPLDAQGDWTWGWQVVSGGKDLEFMIESSGLAFSAIAGLWPERQAGIVILVPTSGLLISKLVLPTLLEGARSILMTDTAEPPLPFGRFAILLGIAAAIHILVLSAATGAAMSWARSVKGRAEAKGSKWPILRARVRLGFGIAARLALAVFFPLGAGYLLGTRVDWAYLLEWEPGLTGWLVVALVIGLLRNVSRLSWLRGPSSQVRKMRLLLKR